MGYIFTDIIKLKVRDWKIDLMTTRVNNYVNKFYLKKKGSRRISPVVPFTEKTKLFRTKSHCNCLY